MNNTLATYFELEGVSVVMGVLETLLEKEDFAGSVVRSGLVQGIPGKKNERTYQLHITQDILVLITLCWQVEAFNFTYILSLGYAAAGFLGIEPIGANSDGV